MTCFLFFLQHLLKFKLFYFSILLFYCLFGLDDDFSVVLLLLFLIALLTLLLLWCSVFNVVVADACTIKKSFLFTSAILLIFSVVVVFAYFFSCRCWFWHDTVEHLLSLLLLLNCYCFVFFSLLLIVGVMFLMLFLCVISVLLLLLILLHSTSSNTNVFVAVVYFRVLLQLSQQLLFFCCVISWIYCHRCCFLMCRGRYELTCCVFFFIILRLLFVFEDDNFDENEREQKCYYAAFQLCSQWCTYVFIILTISPI